MHAIWLRSVIVLVLVVCTNRNPMMIRRLRTKLFRSSRPVASALDNATALSASTPQLRVAVAFQTPTPGVSGYINTYTNAPISTPSSSSPSSSSPTTTSSTRPTQYQASHNLVDLPDDVASGCLVFRNIVTPDEENALWMELKHVLERQGEEVCAKPNMGNLNNEKKSSSSSSGMKSGHSNDNSNSTSGANGQRPAAAEDDNKVVRNVSADLHGFDEFIEAKDWKTEKVRKFPGLRWSPTLAHIARTIGKDLLGVIPDTALVMEHRLPGYEMHTERPAVGSQFLILNLLSPFILRFDDEASGRYGAAMIPSRSVTRIGGELRWGWRWGQQMGVDVGGNGGGEEEGKDIMRMSKKRGGRSFYEVDATEPRLCIVLYKMTQGLIQPRTVLTDASGDSASSTGRQMTSDGAPGNKSNSLGGLRDDDASQASVPEEYDIPVSQHQPPTSSGSSGEQAASAMKATAAPAAAASTPVPMDTIEKMNVFKQDLGKLQGFTKQLQQRTTGGQDGGVTADWLNEKARQITNGRCSDFVQYAAKGEHTQPLRQHENETVEQQWGEIERMASAFRNRMAVMTTASGEDAPKTTSTAKVPPTSS